MADANFIIKQFDFGNREPLKAILEQLVVDPDTGEPILDGEDKEQFEPVDLTGCTVHVLLEAPGEARVKTSAMKILGDPKEGRVEYQFEDADEDNPADLAVAADHKMEFEVLGPEGKARQSIPNSGYYILRVEKASAKGKTE